MTVVISFRNLKGRPIALPPGARRRASVSFTIATCGVPRAIESGANPNGQLPVATTGFPSPQPPAPSPDLLPVFYPDIPILDLHRWPDMDLHADQAICWPVRRVVVDDNAHQVAVEDVGEGVAADHDVDRVPVVGDLFGELGAVGEGRDELRNAAADDTGDLAAKREEERPFSS